mgnify:CR=1 FL=1
MLLRKPINVIQGRIFSKIIYEQALSKVVDVYSSTIKSSFIIQTPDNKLLLVERNTKANLIDVKGWKIALQVKEGDVVRPRQRVALVLTKKYEVRSIRSSSKGVVVYIGWVYEERPERYIIVVVNSDDIRELRLRKRVST